MQPEKHYCYKVTIYQVGDEKIEYEELEILEWTPAGAALAAVRKFDSDTAGELDIVSGEVSVKVTVVPMGRTDSYEFSVTGEYVPAYFINAETENAENKIKQI